MKPHNHTVLNPIMQLIVLGPTFNCIDYPWIRESFKILNTLQNALFLLPPGCSEDKNEMLCCRYGKAKIPPSEEYPPSDTRLDFFLTIFSFEEKVFHNLFLYMEHHFPEGVEQVGLLEGFSPENFPEIWMSMLAKYKKEKEVTH